ncbi:sugar-binding transcriptional regulator [Vibrio ziniensis]|uniref:Sugar-binding transcriptional regulator n=1 Tax=Vibrio ziniensis TaxID=2711221 RepID=A0A6G7CQS8_9VIBR|nr:sugar-binding transcriptional regulator [Vibrio ziniensis]QIH44440.1 sugar-binding transcriptional regulator [Vibrio ziniensis]
MLKRDEQRLLVKIATLYYNESKKQSDIAKELDLSQSFVSRALSRCTKEGIVKITVVQPSNVYLNVESELQKKYSLVQAIIVDVTEDASDDDIKRAIGSAAAHYMQTSLPANSLVGVSAWSGTIREMVEQSHPLSIKAKGVVQLLGGVGVNGNAQASMLTHSLAEMLNCKAYLLPSQSIERTVDYKQMLLKTDEVSSVVNMFDEVDFALVGIGMLEPSHLLKSSGNYYKDDMVEDLAARGAVGDICLHYFDENGKPVLGPDEDPVIGMDLNSVKRCPRVVALAGGMDKLAAIKGALTGGYIDILIIDVHTAKKLL